jgi:predicted GH43/DUF377 family glycosyl hydrolase
MLAPHPAPERIPLPPGFLRSIAAPPPVGVERLHGGRPVLGPVPDHPWESRVVLNPAAEFVAPGPVFDRLVAAWGLSQEEAHRLRTAGGAVPMVYRAQGAVDPRLDMAPSSFGLAVLTPGMEVVRRHVEPVLRPEAEFHNLGLEDPRCTRVGDTFYLYYTGYTDPSPEDPFDRRVHVCLATTRDFLDWTLHGPVAGDLNEVNNKNAALLPEPVDGRWLLLHRPMEGPDAMAVHWATAPDPAGPWTSQGLLFASYRYREFTRSWVGAGGPPLALGDDRFLAIYHQGHFTAEGTREYDLAAALLDFRAAQPVRARIEPLLRPTGTLETEGDEELGVDNVVFSCANYRWEDRLVIPYAGADSRIFGATLPFDALVAALHEAAGGANGEAG